MPAGAAPADPVPVEAAPVAMAFGEAARPTALLRAEAQSLDLSSAVEEALEAEPCSFVGAQSVGLDGRVILTGFAPINRTRSGVGDTVDSIVGVSDVDTAQVAELPVPCALTALLGDLDRGRGSGILSAPDRSTPRIHNFEFYDPLRIGLRAPKFPAHIIVDYYAADGRVYHIDHKNWPDEAFPPERYMELGGRHGIGLDVTLIPPGGQEYMLVMASDAPLWTGERPVASAPDEYIQNLAARIESHVSSGGQLEVLGTIIETGEPDDN